MGCNESKEEEDEDGFRPHLRIVDDSKYLTKDELRTLKQIAGWSKAAQLFFSVVLGLIAIFGLPTIVEFLSKHVVVR